MLPPATPSTRTSMERTHVGCSSTVTYLISGLPPRMTQMLVLVPPTSKNTPPATRVCSSAPATLAAGPERTVEMGRARNAPMSDMPPSPRITISGALTPAPRSADST